MTFRSKSPHPTLVAAAQAGDRRALDDLIRAHLPLVYTIVRRALSGHPDVDDVVQETMLRALRELRELRDPASFRSWLAAIAVRQISTYLHRRRLFADRIAALDELTGVPDVAASFEGLMTLQVDLSAQRRQVVRASQWLDPDDRTLLALWWLEVAGELTRAQLAEALGVSVAHAGVRVQRMRGQLDLSRGVVAALDARPRCPQLDSIAAAGGVFPGTLLRKRIARHVRSCARCSRAGDGRVPTERLLVGLGLLSVPLAITTALAGKVSVGAATASLAAATKSGVVSQLVHAAAAHPVVAAILGVTIAAGAVVTTQDWLASAPPSSAVGVRAPVPVRPSSPVATPRPLAVGPASLEAANEAGHFVASVSTFGILTPLSSRSGTDARQRATFQAVAGLADPDCFSFRLPDGRYLRHSSWRLRAHSNDGTQLFRGDATFCVRTTATAGLVLLESYNYPGWFLRHRGDEVWVDRSDGTAAFRADSSFIVRPPLSA